MSLSPLSLNERLSRLFARPTTRHLGCKMIRGLEYKRETLTHVVSLPTFLSMPRTCGLRSLTTELQTRWTRQDIDPMSLTSLRNVNITILQQTMRRRILLVLNQMHRV